MYAVRGRDMPSAPFLRGRLHQVRVLPTFRHGRRRIIAQLQPQFARSCRELQCRFPERTLEGTVRYEHDLPLQEWCRVRSLQHSPPQERDGL